MVDGANRGVASCPSWTAPLLAGVEAKSKEDSGTQDGCQCTGPSERKSGDKQQFLSAHLCSPGIMAHLMFAKDTPGGSLAFFGCWA